jgi:hypothetical protein
MEDNENKLKDLSKDAWTRLKEWCAENPMSLALAAGVLVGIINIIL